MDPSELAAWLRLLETPLLGRESARKLLAAFGSPEAVLDASALARRAVIGPELATALAESSSTLDELVRSTIAWLSAGSGDSPRHVIALGDPRYPARLLEAADPPLLLYAQGRIELLNSVSVAVVGSRNPTPQGSENALAFASQFSQAGLTVVSGLALGIDAAAHRGGLSGPGRTVAVVGTGLDRVYPRQNRDLAHQIAVQGLVLSEYAIGTPPLAHNFPQRNRIIAGLSQGTLVVEAALQSGSLITARLAAEIGRDVFALPGSIHSPLSRGCHSLIKQGAKLVDSAQDVLEEIRGPVAAPPQAPLDEQAPGNADSLLEAMAFDPVSLDALVARTGWPAPQLNARLLELELSGQVARLPGQLFQRIATG